METLKINGWELWYEHIHMTIIHPFKKKKKEGSPSICDNVNGPWGHYVNQGK